MAIKKVYDLSVDLKRTRIKANVPVLVQGDSTEFRLRLLENGKELTPGQISGVTSVELLSGYDAQTIIRTVGTMQGSEAVFSIEQGELFKTGQVKAMVRLADADDRISTLNFEYQVISDLTANYIPGEQDVSIFQQYIADAQQKIDEMAATDVQQLSAQLAETVKKGETGVLDLNIFDEPTRNVLQGQTPGTINAVLGIGNVTPRNTNFIAELPNLIDKTKIVYSKLSAGGSINDSTFYDMTDYIPVSVGDVLTFSRGIRYVTAHNNDKTYTKYVTSADKRDVPFTFTADFNGFIIGTVHKARTAEIVLNRGTTADINASAYGYKLDTTKVQIESGGLDEYLVEDGTAWGVV